MVKSTINIQQRNTILLLSMHYTKVINSWRGNKCQNLLNLFTVRIYSDMWQIFQNNILFKFQEFSYLHVNLLLTDSSRTLNALSLHFLGRPGTENPIFVFFFLCSFISSVSRWYMNIKTLLIQYSSFNFFFKNYAL